MDSASGDSVTLSWRMAMALKDDTEVLDLDRGNVGPWGDQHILKYGEVVALADWISTHKHVKQLRLGSHSLGDGKLAVLAEGLAVNTSLEEVHLWNNSIGDEGTTALARAVKMNSTLKGLVLRNNRIGDPGAVALAAALKFNVGLKTLIIFHNNIEDKGAGVLATSLMFNVGLKTLSLHKNRISGTGAGALAAALQINTSIRHLLVNKNTTVEGVRPIRESNLRTNAALSPQEMVEWRKTLAKHTRLDAQDNRSKWFHAEIVDVISEEEAKVADLTATPKRPAGATLRVHFLGWADKWDLWFKRDSVQLQPEFTIVPNWRDFRLNDVVEMKVGTIFWSLATVKAVDRDKKLVTCTSIRDSTKTGTFGFASDLLCAPYTFSDAQNLRKFAPLPVAPLPVVGLPEAQLAVAPLPAAPVTVTSVTPRPAAPPAAPRRDPGHGPSCDTHLGEEPESKQTEDASTCCSCNRHMATITGLKAEIQRLNDALVASDARSRDEHARLQRRIDQLAAEAALD